MVVRGYFEHTATSVTHKLEQDLPAAIGLQRLLERFLELVERVHMFHCSGERSLSDQVSQLLVNLLDLCSGRVAYPQNVTALSAMPPRLAKSMYLDITNPYIRILHLICC